MDEVNWSTTLKISYLDQLTKLVSADCLKGYEKAKFLDRVEQLCDSIEEDLSLRQAEDLWSNQAPRGSEK
ncbi:hypothetical protein ACFW4G_03565 [Paenibacillus lactis]|uniref:hypothetical protein n=1 Tax=Paenibacillus lactis TaxID=228574 RepID=UPI00367BD025